MLVINPDECIDCGVCEPECPANAIKPDTDTGITGWIAMNAKYAAALWEPVSEKSEPMTDAERWDGRSGKLEKFFGATNPSLA